MANESGWSCSSARGSSRASPGKPSPRRRSWPRRCGGKAEAVLLGSGVGLAAAEVAKRDLAAVHVADHEALRTYTPGAYIGALAPAIRAAEPDLRGLPPHLSDRSTTCRAWPRPWAPACCPR